MSLVLTVWGCIAINKTDGLSLTEVEHIYDKRHRCKSYGGNHEDSGICVSESNQEYPQPPTPIEMVAWEQYSFSLYDSGPESLISLPSYASLRDEP